MSSYYLIDLHTNPLSSSRILDVAETTTLVGSSTPMNGGTIVRVPDYVGVKDPTNVTTLLSQKYAGLLAYYAGFTYVTYDDLLDAADVDFTEPTLKGKFGDRNCIVLPPDFGVIAGRFQSTVAALSGPAPSQAIITWEVYRVVLADPATDRAVLTYVEMPASSFTCNVTFNNGVTAYPATDGAVLNIPPIGQGTQFAIRLTNTSTTDDLYVGSWAVIY